MSSALPSTILGAAAAAVDVTMGAAQSPTMSLRPRPRRTKDIGSSVAFIGACVGTFTDKSGPLSNKDDLKSVAGKGGGGGSAPRGARGTRRPLLIRLSCPRQSLSLLLLSSSSSTAMCRQRTGSAGQPSLCCWCRTCTDRFAAPVLFITIIVLLLCSPHYLLLPPPAL